MESEKNQKRRFEMGRADFIVLIVLAVLMVAVIALTVMEWAGLALVKGELMLQLSLTALALLVGWGGYRLLRRIRSQRIRLVVTSLLALVFVTVLMLAFTLVTYFSPIAIPQKYATLTSPSGNRRLVVMRVVDTDEDRAALRRDARLSADPEDDEEITFADSGYIYRAFPLAMTGFYRKDADVEGEIILDNTEALQSQASAGEQSPENSDETSEAAEEEPSEDGEEPSEASEETAEADADISSDIDEETTEAEEESDVASAQAAPAHGQLMVEWAVDESWAHLFVDHPSPTEGGECLIRFTAPEGED